MNKKWTVQEIENLLALINQLDIVSLNALIIPAEGDTPVELGDAVKDNKPGPQELLEDEDAKSRLLYYVNKLPARENKIIKLRFGLIDRQPKTLEEIARLYGVTRERIRQIEGKALKKLKWLIMVKGKYHSMNDF